MVNWAKCDWNKENIFPTKFWLIEYEETPLRGSGRVLLRPFPIPAGWNRYDGWNLGSYHGLCVRKIHME